MLTLESESGGSVSDPSPADISQALRELDGDANNFAILKRADTDYIQAAGDAPTGLTIEYHDPHTDEHFTAGTSLPLEQAIELFESYRAGGDWRRAVRWTPMELPSTKKGCAGMVVLIAAGAMIGWLIA